MEDTQGSRNQKFEWGRTKETKKRIQITKRENEPVKTGSSGKKIGAHPSGLEKMKFPEASDGKEADHIDCYTIIDNTNNCLVLLSQKQEVRNRSQSRMRDRKLLIPTSGRQTDPLKSLTVTDWKSYPILF